MCPLSRMLLHHTSEPSYNSVRQVVGVPWRSSPPNSPQPSSVTPPSTENCWQFFSLSVTSVRVGGADISYFDGSFATGFRSSTSLSAVVCPSTASVGIYLGVYQRPPPHPGGRQCGGRCSFSTSAAVSDSRGSCVDESWTPPPLLSRSSAVWSCRGYCVDESWTPPPLLSLSSAVESCRRYCVDESWTPPPRSSCSCYSNFAVPNLRRGY